MSSTQREALLGRLGIHPSVATLVRAALDAAITAAEARTDIPGHELTALDAGCGRVSQLRSFRPRLARIVGADLHAPTAPLAHLDDFTLVDLCGASDAFEPDTFDVILSSFTLEHFGDPPAAMRNLRSWLRPGGTLVATTVNRRHPFVRAYLGLPGGLRERVQPLVKSRNADAHRLVGACNDPTTIVRTLGAAGFDEMRLETVGHLARAWGRTWPTFVLGLVGDVIAQRSPSRRSTIVAVARA